MSVSAHNLFFFLVAIQASGDGTLTCPDLFSLARILLIFTISVTRGDRATVKFKHCCLFAYIKSNKIQGKQIVCISPNIKTVPWFIILHTQLMILS